MKQETVGQKCRSQVCIVFSTVYSVELIFILAFLSVAVIIVVDLVYWSLSCR